MLVSNSQLAAFVQMQFPGWLKTMDEYYRDDVQNILNTTIDSLLQRACGLRI